MSLERSSAISATAPTQASTAPTQASTAPASVPAAVPATVPQPAAATAQKLASPDTVSMLAEAEERGAFSNRTNYNWPLQKHRCAVEILQGNLAGMHASVWKVEADDVSIHLWNSHGKPVRHVVDVSKVRVLDAEEAKAARRLLNGAKAKATSGVLLTGKAALERPPYPSDNASEAEVDAYLKAMVA